MKDGHSVVEFVSDGVIKIAPFSLIRNAKDKSPFNPRSGQDLPTELVQVKWQKSMSGDIEDDGYYDAKVLIIAGSIKSAELKAAEKGIILPPAALLTLPSSKTPMKVQVLPDKLRQRAAHSRTDSTSAHGVGVGVRSAKRLRSASSRDKGKPEMNCDLELETDEPKPKKKKKRNPIAKNPIAVKRLKNVISQATSQNPIMNTTPENNDAIQVARASPHPIMTSSVKTNVKNQDTDNLKQDTVSINELVCDQSKSKEKLDDVPHKGNMEETNVVVKSNISTSPARSNNSSDSQETVRADNGNDSDISLPNSFVPMHVENSGSSSQSSQSSSESDSEDATSSLAEENKVLKEQVKKLTADLEKIQRQFTLTNNLRVELRDKCEKLTERNNALQDLLCKVDVSKVQRDTSEVKSTPARSATSKTVSSVSDVLDADVSTNKDCQPAQQKSSGSKTKKPKKGDILDHPTLNLTCQTVLGHLQGTKLIHPDKKNKIDIGYGVKVSKDAFEKNFSDNKLDVQKVCRNLTSMTWTREERTTRSLTGMVNNKFPDAERKAMASPPKVAGVLGAVKAHMLNMGDCEGPSMSTSLLLCHKAIGQKLASDAAKFKKKN